MPKPKDNSLATVLALAGLAQNQQTQGDQAQAQRVHAALQMLGLMQDQEHGNAALDVQRQNYQDEAQHRQTADVLARDEANMRNWALSDASSRGYEENANVLAHQKAQEAQVANQLADSSGQFWSGTLPMEYARNATVENSRKDQHQLGVLGEITKAYGTGSPVNPVLAQYLGGQDQSLGQAQEQTHQAAVDAEVAKYNTITTGMTPAQKQQTISTSSAHPDVKAKFIAGLGIGPNITQPTNPVTTLNYGPTPIGQDVAPYIPPAEETLQQRQLREQRSGANFQQHFKNILAQLLTGPNPFSN